jgi:hypothetical protein
VKVTESRDGVARATLRVDFDMLGLAVLKLMNDNLLEDYEDPVRVQSYLAQLTKQEVEGTLRSRLQDGGYERIAFGEEQLEPALVKALAETAMATVRRLFGEFDSPSERE